MNCEQFSERLHELLDRRESVTDDEVLRSHARRCHRCAESLHVWAGIDSMIEPRSPMVGRRFSGLQITVAMAAVLLLATSLAFSLGSVLDQRPRLANRMEQGEQANRAGVIRLDGLADTSLAEEHADADPVVATVSSNDWWQTVAREDWVAGAMPSVRWVEDGVVPIGRSMRRAVVILLSPASETSADASGLRNPVDASSEMDAFREQSSNFASPQRILV